MELTNTGKFYVQTEALNTGIIKGSPIYADNVLYFAEPVGAYARYYQVKEFNRENNDCLEAYENFYKKSIDRNIITINLPNNDFIAVSPYLGLDEMNRRRYIGRGTRLKISNRLYFSTNTLYSIVANWEDICDDPEKNPVDELFNTFIAEWDSYDTFIPIKKLVMPLKVMEVQTKLLYFTDGKKGELNGSTWERHAPENS